MSTQEFEAVIGLEIHAQLRTRSKLFSSASTEFHAPENSHVAPVDMGLPGSLPVVNLSAVEMAVRAGVALGCTIHPVSIWARKHYFYPDLPKGYQISQFEYPLCTDGKVTVPTPDTGEKVIGIHRIHMEEDAGKNIHDADGTWVNLNRAGTPLIEIVSEPDMRTAKEAAAYMKKIRTTLKYIGVCDGNMEEGNLRCDVNISLRPRGTEKFGTKVELKNINSFRFVERAIESEIKRQLECLKNGETIVQETRGYDASSDTSYTMRKKEDAHDYRYFPEPDLPELHLPVGLLERVQKEMPELPEAKRERLMKEYGLPAYDADVLTSSAVLADYFEAAAKGLKTPKSAANWIMTTILRDVESDVESADQIPVSSAHLNELLSLIDRDVISGKIAKTVYEEMVKSKKSPQAIVDEQGLVQVTDSSALVSDIEAVLAENPQEMQQLLGGKDKLVGFFIGQIMKRTKGKANPKVLQETFMKVIQEKRGK